MRTNIPVTDKERNVSHQSNILSTAYTKGVIRYVNEDFIALSGFELNELVGQAHNIIRHPDMPPIAFKMLWDALKNGRSWKGVVKNRCKNGDHYWVDAYATPIINDGGGVEYQSVRVAPNIHDVERAKSLYELLNKGQGEAPPV